jgi:ABC-type phosphate transport system permease subunit
MFQILEFLFYFILEGKLIVLILYLIHDLYLETLFLFFFAMWLILMDKGCTVFAVLFGCLCLVHVSLLETTVLSLFSAHWMAEFNVESGEITW